MKQLWLNSALRHPWLILLAGLLLVILMSAGAGKLYFRGDYRIFFADDNPQQLAFEQMQHEFNKSDNLLIGVAPADAEVFSAELLTVLKQLTDAAWQTPYSIRIDSITNFQHTEAEQDDLLVEDLLPDPALLDAARIDKIRRIALAEPALLHRLVSANAAVAAINITIQLPEQDLDQETKEAYRYVQQLLEQFKQQHPQIDFYLTGVVAMNYAFGSEAEQDASTLIPLMFIMIVLMLAFLLRSFFSALATVIIIVITIATTLGLAGWAGIFLSMATVNVPVIVMTLAVADSVHVIASMQFALAQGNSKDEAIRYSMQRNLMPIIITSATTAVGFLMLNFSEVPILHDLGNMTAAGVVLAGLYSIVLLPALLTILPIRPAAAVVNTRLMDTLANWVIRHYRLILPCSAVITLLFAALVSLNRVNDEAVKYFDTSTEFRQAIDFMEQNLSPLTTVDIALHSGQSSGVNQPAFLAATEQFSQWLWQQPEVTHVSSVTDVIKRLNKNMHGDDPAYYRIPQQQDEIAQYFLMYEMSLPYGLDLNNQLNTDRSATRLSATLHNLGSKELTAFEQRASAHLQQYHAAYPATIASTALMFAHIGEANMTSMLRTLPLALLLISLLLIFSLRSWRLGLYSLLPNVVPAVIGFGIWGLYSGEINLALSVVASISLGIIVDDTVHFMAKYQYARREGRDTETAIRYAFHSVGRALWITTAVLAVGFSVLMLSGFRLNSEMGLLTAMIILAALVVDFLFLPAFLLKFDRKGATPDA